MKKNRAPRLKLSRETVNVLNPERLRMAVGGESWWSCKKEEEYPSATDCSYCVSFTC